MSRVPRFKEFLRRCLRELPGGTRLLQARNRWIAARRLRKFGDATAVFTHHFQNREWGEGESVSGSGSTLAYTSGVREALPALFAQLKVRRVLDAPCGDFHWMQHVQWETEIEYVGADIVRPLIEENSRLYSQPGRRFACLDITQDSLPSADLWLCRDCLFHLSNRDIAAALDNFLRSDIPYLLTSTHPDCKSNVDIVTGGFRHLNLQLMFDLPPPLRVIDDWIPGYPRRQLALWTQAALRASRG